MHVPTRPPLADARGFTMVELLVVILIVGILAMIALPAFIGQRMKGEDSDAQQMVRTVATALATFHTDKDTYDASRAELEKIEPAVREATGTLEVDGDAKTFTITEMSESDTTFTLELTADGKLARSCSIPGRGLCRSDSSW
jgi:prepilin-type N-terminal cleavage/methylation domain-containing protein